MPRFEIIIKKIEKYVLDVVANSEQEAKEIAEQKILESPAKYHDDSDFEIECYEDI
jgi:hypothetical protein